MWKHTLQDCKKLFAPNENENFSRGYFSNSFIINQIQVKTCRFLKVSSQKIWKSLFFFVPLHYRK